MTQNSNTITKSFFWLLTIAVLGSFTVLYLDFKNVKTINNPENIYYDNAQMDSNTINQPTISKDPNIDTSNWNEYKNALYKFSFKHDPVWKVRQKENNEYNILEIDPGIKYDNFKIYISKTGYFALSNVPVQTSELAGKTAIDLDGQVLGIENDSKYFTFDLGSSISLKPYFQAMLKTVKFE